MKHLHYFLTLLLGTILASCAAAPASPTPTPTPEPPTATPAPEITQTCLVTDVGNVDDGTFNQYAYEGLLEAVDDNDLPEPIVVESTEGADDSAFADNIAQCIDEGAQIVVTVGFLLQNATVEAARANPDVYFVGIDQDMTAVEDAPENAVGIQFREEQAGFLVGALAALAANHVDSDTIAGVYGVAVPAVQRFRTGYEQGAQYINPDWEIGTNILGEYTGSFVDREIGEDLAQEYLDAGASVIFGAGGLVGSSAIAYAARRDTYVIGVDQDEYITTFESGAGEGSENVISSAVKRVDQGVIDMVDVLSAGDIASFPGGDNYVLGVVRGGIGFAPPHEADLPESIYNEVRDVLGMMIDGEITVAMPQESTPEATAESD